MLYESSQDFRMLCKLLDSRSHLERPPFRHGCQAPCLILPSYIAILCA